MRSRGLLFWKMVEYTNMNFSKMQTYFFFTLLIGALVLAFFLFLPYLSALLFATGLAIVFYPVYAKMLKLLQGKSSVAALATILIILLTLLIPLSLFGFQIFKEAHDLYARIAAEQINLDALEALYAPIENRIQEFVPGFEFNLVDYAQQTISWMAQNFAGVFSGIVRFAFTLSLGLLALYYLLKDGEKVKHKIIELSPLEEKHTKEIFSKLQATVRSVVRGSLTIAFVQGVLTGIGFALFGISNPTLWGGFAFIAALVPSLGTSLIIAPGVLFLVVTGHGLQAAGLAVWGVTAVGLIDNLLGPRLIQRGLPIHPLLILLSVLGGLNFFGLVGFLLGPLILSLLFTLLKVYQEEFRAR